MKPPSLQTEFGPVSEMARARAAENMRKDPAIKQRVEELLISKHGEQEGKRLARQNYRESYGWRKVWLDFKERIGL